MDALKFGVGAFVVLALLLVLAGRFGLLAGHAPDDLGVRDGRLKRPSKTDNSVSSQADLWPGHPQQRASRIEPLALTGDGASTMLRLRDIVAATPGARIVTFRPDYLHAEFTTAVMKFTDDTEFWLDTQTGVVQVRSASRLGKVDFGANRKRIEGIRRQLQGG